MTDFNLDEMSLKEPKQLQKDLAKAISTYEDRQKAEARTKLEAIAKGMGYVLADLVSTAMQSTHVCPQRQNTAILTTVLSLGPVVGANRGGL